MSNAKKVEKFVNSVKIEHFEDFPDGNNITLEENYDLSMRLDHQGVGSYHTNFSSVTRLTVI